MAENNNIDPIALKKLRKAQYQRTYRSNLTDLQKKVINDKTATINRTRYNTDLTYKNNKNQNNKDKAKLSRDLAKLYLSNNIIINTNIIHKSHNIDIDNDTVDIVQNIDIDNDTVDIIQPVQNIDIVQPFQHVQSIQTVQNIQQSETSNLPKNHIFCTYCNKSYIKYYFNKHMLSKKHLNHIQN